MCDIIASIIGISLFLVFLPVWVEIARDIWDSTVEMWREFLK